MGKARLAESVGGNDFLPASSVLCLFPAVPIHRRFARRHGLELFFGLYIPVKAVY